MPSNKRIMACLLSLSIASPAASQEVATTYDEEWISLSGTVDTVLAKSFVLDYGENDITVELDQLDWEIDSSVLQSKQMTVTGRMDRNLYASRSIEAAVVYVPALNEYIYADPEDEEGDPSMTRRFAPGLFSSDVQNGDWVSFSGRVTAIEGDEIMVNAGDSMMRVDTSLLPGALYTPDLAVGDRVLVSGEMDSADLFERREIEASSVTRLTDAG